ncbi:uncharacterized protein F5891DRAFT_61332 [Suillus fuscotomentosus]|uniref:Uncharacterized protein n=1 Tax=Suillus fuscotomentosus TaxID=1912939 RepID=A0AAD4ED44_9AGAM|nr:uncharacterized protein F5891DRAFT_61332 [Suillus fuscotomentosus]KAG1903952.1 hypothetical protein F5891DRAFT_61332 [Suillus fuscotomentosus]
MLLLSTSVNGRNTRTRSKIPTGPFVILLKPNFDWLEATRKCRAWTARFIPDSAKVSTGADGSVGGLGTRDTINSDSQLSGIQFGNKEVKFYASTVATRRREKYDGRRACSCERDRRQISPSCAAGWGYGLGAPD